MEQQKKMSYNNYLKSTHWKNTRNNFRAKRRCFICRKKEGLNLHHKRYTSLGFEKQRDLRWLCSECHNKIHKYKLEDVLRQMKIKRVVLRSWLKSLEKRGQWLK